ncbi:MAG: uroporphyrinogen-III synthase, partial [Gammaproteobacteria bacterium]
PMTAPREAARAARRILITRSEDDASAWADALTRAGAEAVVLPCIDAEPIVDAALATALRDAARRADWVVFTSRRGVEAFVRLVGTTSTKARVAAVGPATADAARRALGRTDLVGERGTGESLADALIEAVRPARGADASSSPRVVLALAANARDVLERKLREAGIDVERFDVYRTVPTAPRAPRISLASLDVDAVWLASPSAVTGFLNQVELDADVALVAIGPSTAAAIRERGLAVAAEAAKPSFEGLLEATP